MNFNHISKVVRAVFLAAFVLALFTMGSGCSTVNQPETPTPTDTSTSLGRILIDSDTTGTALISLERLKIDRSKAFTINTKDFRHGTIEIIDNSYLAYVPFNTSWSADSGIVKVCQGSCREGTIRIKNARKISAEDTTTPTPLADMNPILVITGGTQFIDNPIGTEEQGAVIDSIWGYFYTADIVSDGHSIRYLAMGGAGNGLNLGADQIYYRVRRPNGRYFKGTIPIILDDICLVRAKKDLVQIGSGGGFIAFNTLIDNDSACGNTPQPEIKLRLQLRPYEGKKQVQTPFGEIRDTTDDFGEKAFYYRRLATGNQADTTFYFLEEGGLQRISKGKLILSN